MFEKGDKVQVNENYLKFSTRPDRKTLKGLVFTVEAVTMQHGKRYYMIRHGDRTLRWLGESLLNPLK